jgi:hypothetical protein
MICKNQLDSVQVACQFENKDNGEFFNYQAPTYEDVELGKTVSISRRIVAVPF